MSENTIVNKLVKKVKQGDTNAFRLLVEEYQHMAFTVALNIVNNREEAEEVMQDAFIKVYKNILQYKGDAKFSSWLYKIVYNTALTRLKKKKIDQISLADNDYEKDYGISIHEGWVELISDDQKKYIQQALDKLNEQDRLVLTLYYLAEEGLNEICVITNEKKSTVKVRLHRARAKLFDQLNVLLKDELKALV